MHAEIIAEARPHDESHPIHLMRNAFWAIKSFDVHAQTPPDIMHNWSIGLVHHLFEAIVYEYTRYLRGFTETRKDRQGLSYQARLIPDTAIARLFNETLKRRLDAYCVHTTGFRLTRRARKRFGRYADHVVLSKKQPANMRADEADALFMALPTALEQLLHEFEEPLLKKGWTRPLAEDPTAKIIAAVAALLQWYVRIRKPFVANDLLRLQDGLESALGRVKSALPKKSGQSEETAYNFPKFHQVI